MSRVTLPAPVEIAEEIGVDHKTVGAARKAVGEDSPPDRTGRDGKSYPSTQPAKPAPTRGKDAIRERVLEAIRHQLAIESFSGKNTGREFWCRVVIGLPPRPQPITWEQRQ